MAYKELFQPTDGGEKWTISMSQHQGSGYDRSVFLDKEKSTPESGYMFEIGINPDGSVIVQLTTRPGYDSAMLLVASPAQIKVESLYDDQQMVIVDPASDLPQPMTDKQKLAIAIQALRGIQYKMPALDIEMRVQEALEQIGVPLVEPPKEGQ